MRRYLLVLMLFTFARASETFILLLGHQLGVATVELLLLWAALNLCKAATSTWGGRLADSLGRGALMLLGWTTFSVSFLMLGMVEHSVGLWTVSIFYGLCAGMSEGAERANISDYANPRERGTAFGWYHLDGGHRSDSSRVAVRVHLAISGCADGVLLRWKPGCAISAVATDLGLASAQAATSPMTAGNLNSIAEQTRAPA